MKKFKLSKLLSILLIGLIIGSSLAGLTAFAKIYSHGRFLLSTEVAGINLSYLTFQEAKKAINKEITNYLQENISITINNQTQTFKPKQLGITPLAEETLNFLTKIDSTQINILSLPNLLENGQKASILIQTDHQQLQETLNQAFNLHQIAPQSASFYFQGKTLHISPEQQGETIDYKALITQLKENAQQLKPAPLTLNTTPTPPEITEQDLLEQKQNILDKLNHPITLIDPIYEDNWKISLINHLDWVSFENPTETSITNFFQKNQNKIPKIKINQEPLNLYIDQKISKWLDKETQPTEIFLDEENQVKIKGAGTDGLEIQRDKLAHMIALAAENFVSEIQVPIYVKPAEIIISEEVKAMGITERIAQGHSSYYGSPKNRVHNIKVSAENFNGIIIPPGEEFSFNKNLGKVDAASGYFKELVIKPEGTIPEYGGGICQLSTTIYRAALFGGLDITNRREHSYAVGYYSQVLGHGLDATIYLGGQDFQFRNDTKHPILIHAYVDNDYELYINLYGTSDGRKTQLDGPQISNHRTAGPTEYIQSTNLPTGETKQVQKPQNGFMAKWNYQIIYPDGTKKEEIIKSNYKAVPAKILIGQ